MYKCLKEEAILLNKNTNVMYYVISTTVTVVPKQQ